MNTNEKFVRRVGVILLAMAACTAIPLAFAAFRPVRPERMDVHADTTRQQSQKTSASTGSVTQETTVTHNISLAKVARSSIRIDCQNAKHKIQEQTALGTIVLFCHN